MPESVRWLMSQNKKEEAIKTLRKIAKTNKKDLSEDKLEFIKDMVRLNFAQNLVNSYRFWKAIEQR